MKGSVNLVLKFDFEVETVTQLIVKIDNWLESVFPHTLSAAILDLYQDQDSLHIEGYRECLECDTYFQPAVGEIFDWLCPACQEKGYAEDYDGQASEHADPRYPNGQCEVCGWGLSPARVCVSTTPAQQAPHTTERWTSMSRLIIEVRGGVVCNVESDDDYADYVIIDWDDVNEQDWGDLLDINGAGTISGWAWNWPYAAEVLEELKEAVGFGNSQVREEG